MPQYKCTKCAATMYSKNPAIRSVFPDNHKVQLIRSLSCIMVVDDPARPAGQEMMNLRTKKNWTREKAGQDVEIRITVHEHVPGDYPGDTPADAFKSWLRMMNSLSEQDMNEFVCASFEGHNWHSDEPPDV